MQQAWIVFVVAGYFAVLRRTSAINVKNDGVYYIEQGTIQTGLLCIDNATRLETWYQYNTPKQFIYPYRKELTILPQGFKKSLEGKWMCVANDSLIVNFQLKFYARVTPTITVVNQGYKLGEIVELSCQAYNEVKTIQLQWQRNQRTAVTSNTGKNASVNLRFPLTTTSIGDEFKCVIVGRPSRYATFDWNKRMTLFDMSLTHIAAVRWKIIKLADFGSMVRLECKVRVISSRISLVFKQHGQNHLQHFTPDEHYGNIVVQKQAAKLYVVYILGIGRENFGTYECFVPEDPQNVFEATLFLEDSSVVITKPLRGISAAKGDEEIMYAFSPMSIYAPNFRWIHPTKGQLDMTGPQLYIAINGDDDFGLYEVQNDQLPEEGASATASISVFKYEMHTPYSEISVEVNESVTIRCVAPADHVFEMATVHLQRVARAKEEEESDSPEIADAIYSDGDSPRAPSRLYEAPATAVFTFHRVPAAFDRARYVCATKRHLGQPSDVVTVRVGHFDCGEELYRCPRQRKCINYTQLCDGHVDCITGVDEDDATTCRGCGANEVQCRNHNGEPPRKKCIVAIWTCDGENDCGNNYDESEAVCERKMLSPNSMVSCLDEAHRCADPSMSPLRRQSHFYCPEAEECFPLSYICDGSRDCVNADDVAFDEDLCDPLKVQEPLERSTIEIVEGMRIPEFRCSIFGRFRPIIILRKDAKPIPSNRGIRVVNPNGHRAFTGKQSTFDNYTRQFDRCDDWSKVLKYAINATLVVNLGIATAEKAGTYNCEGLDHDARRVFSPDINITVLRRPPGSISNNTLRTKGSPVLINTMMLVANKNISQIKRNNIFVANVTNELLLNDTRTAADKYFNTSAASSYAEVLYNSTSESGSFEFSSTDVIYVGKSNSTDVRSKTAATAFTESPNMSTIESDPDKLSSSSVVLPNDKGIYSTDAISQTAATSFTQVTNISPDDFVSEKSSSAVVFSNVESNPQTGEDRQSTDVVPQTGARSITDAAFISTVEDESDELSTTEMIPTRESNGTDILRQRGSEIPDRTSGTRQEKQRDVVYAAVARRRRRRSYQ